MSIWQKIFKNFHTITLWNVDLTFYDLFEDRFCWSEIDREHMDISITKKRNNLFSFVSLKHANQKRKYTGHPYFVHLLEVAKMADGNCRLGYEIGLCHDLFEDTNCDARELHEALVRFGYLDSEAWFIVIRVIDLTDVYTVEKSPNMNRKNRKVLEAERLHGIHPAAQTVKYCDLISNAQSIVQNDPKFAVIFINEAIAILAGMIAGNHELYKQCTDEVYSAFRKLIKK